jgi:hypothetical protein
MLIGCMRILMRSANQGLWTTAESLRYEGEKDLQKLLADDPTLIPVADIRADVVPLCVGVRELTIPGSGTIDILAFSPNGDIAIIECKLASNAEIKRKVVGQLFEYAAFVWKMTYEELDARVAARTEKSLADMAQEKASGEFDSAAFRAAVADNLQRGDLILVIVVDQITPELERTIEFLNQCGGGRFSFHALEMRRFQAMGTEILVPHLHGVAPIEPGGRSTPRQRWTEQRFFDTATANTPDLVPIYRDLFDWMTIRADEVRFGTGTVNGSLSYFVDNGTRMVPLFYTETTGFLYLTCTSWKAFPEHLVQQFHQQLIAIPGFEGVPLNLSGWPSKRLSVFRDKPEALSRFKAVVEDFTSRVHAAAEHAD